MTTAIETEARVDLRLSNEAKAAIEEAAALSGQSVDDFARAALVERANQVLEGRRPRLLSERDALIFLSVLDADQPNPALREAATWYKEHYGSAVAD